MTKGRTDFLNDSEDLWKGGIMEHIEKDVSDVEGKRFTHILNPGYFEIKSLPGGTIEAVIFGGNEVKSTYKWSSGDYHV